MRVAFVEVHPPCVDFHEDLWLERRSRERYLVAQLEALGHRARIFVLSDRTRIVKHRHGEVWFCSWDRPAASAHHLRSEEMVRSQLAFEPDLVCLKGLGYALSEGIPERLQILGCAFAVIVGGQIRPVPSVDRLIRIWVESEWQRAQLADEVSCAVEVLPKVVDLHRFSPGRVKRFDVAWIGRLHLHKNFARLCSVAPSRRVVVVGDGPAFTECRALLPRATFLGELGPSDVATVLGQSRCLAIPSGQWGGVPRVAAEALACGVPAIGSRHVVGAIFGEGETAFLDDFANLGQAVESLLTTLESRPELATDLRRKAEERHHSHAALPGFVSALSVLAERTVRSAW